MKDIIYRRAYEKEIPLIISIQTEVFCGEQGIPEELIDVFMEKEPVCWCAEYNGKIIGTVSSWIEDGVTHWGRFVVLPEYRRRHIGTNLARFTFDDIFSQGIDSIYMEARETTVSIVCSMGGVVTGETVEFFEGTVTPVILEKKNYKK